MASAESGAGGDGGAPEQQNNGDGDGDLCSICQSTPVDPVTTACGHVFCSGRTLDEGTELCAGLVGQALHADPDAQTVGCINCRADVLALLRQHFSEQLRASPPVSSSDEEELSAAELERLNRPDSPDTAAYSWGRASAQSTAMERLDPEGWASADHNSRLMMVRQHFGSISASAAFRQHFGLDINRAAPPGVPLAPEDGNAGAALGSNERMDSSQAASTSADDAERARPPSPIELLYGIGTVLHVLVRAVPEGDRYALALSAPGMWRAVRDASERRDDGTVTLMRPEDVFVTPARMQWIVHTGHSNLPEIFPERSTCSTRGPESSLSSRSTSGRRWLAEWDLSAGLARWRRWSMRTKSAGRKSIRRFRARSHYR